MRSCGSPKFDMDETFTSDLTDQQTRIITEVLPATYDEIADVLGVSKSTARDHISDIVAEGVPLGSRKRYGKKEWYDRQAEGEHPTTDTANRYTKTSEKREVTEDLNATAQQMERRLTRLLENSQPPVADGGLVHEPSHEDVVIHSTDDHVGDLTEDEFGNVTYDPDIWRKRRKATFDTSFELVERQESAGYTFDNLHLLLGGDMVTGEGVYPGQSHDLELTLDEQVEAAAEFYMEQIRRAAERFETVQVVVQAGNHGQLQFSSASSGANADRLLYIMLDAMIRQSDLENVTYIRNQSANFTNFEMRGHNGHLRHGDDSLEHIGTSSGKRRWFNWRDKHQFDIAYRGHFHQFQHDTLTRTRETFRTDGDGSPITDGDGNPEMVTETENVPVIMSGSPKPPEEFEESIAEWSQPAATIHGVSDERPLTWMFPVDFESV